MGRSISSGSILSLLLKVSDTGRWSAGMSVKLCITLKKLHEH